MIRIVMCSDFNPCRFGRRSVVSFKSKVADFYADSIGGEVCAGKNKQQKKQDCRAKTHGRVTCYSIFISADNEPTFSSRESIALCNPRQTELAKRGKRFTH